jgi:hypothetical protein
MRNAYKILAIKPQGKRPLGTPKSGWETDIQMVLGESNV